MPASAQGQTPAREHRPSSHSQRLYRKNDTYFIQVSSSDAQRAAEAYNRKYGPQARLRRLEAEERRKKQRQEQINRQKAYKNAQEQRNKMQRKRLEAQTAARVAQCEAAHEADCDNPAFLRKWLNKKYGRKQ